jgi:co-chaperonin GroES (HSP10)
MTRSLHDWDKFRPLTGRVCVREIKPKESDGGIIIPDVYYDNHHREMTGHRGLVLAMGAAASTKSGARVYPGFQVGDVVHFVFASMNAAGTGGATEKGRTSVWPPDGLPCVWLAQEEIIAVEETTSMDTPEDTSWEDDEP